MIEIEYWVTQHEVETQQYTLDLLVEDVCKKFDVCSFSKKEAVSDRKHCLILFWSLYSDSCKTYRLQKSLAVKLNISHSTISHYKHQRVKSKRYEHNTMSLTDFISRGLQKVKFY